jgi:2'-hydroxyisoflavone reductase
MRILILGGTSFVGQAIAVDAVARGYDVTLLNRGTKSAPSGTKSIVGDRLTPGGLANLNGLDFDSVIDTWAYNPPAVTRSIEALKGHVKHYSYISSASVYDRSAFEAGDIFDESTKLFDVDSEDARKSMYQFNKRSAEIAFENQDVPALLVRPGVILGPHESTIIERGRLPWWLTRLQRGGRTLAPGPKDMTIQFVDARDLARFVLDGVENQLAGAYNIVCEPGKVTLASLLELGRELTGFSAELVWKTPREILSSGVTPWQELPLWLDPKSIDYPSVYRLDTGKARSAGLKSRGMTETVADTWSWMQDGELKPVPAPDGYEEPLLGLSPEKEAKLLE